MRRAVAAALGLLVVACGGGSGDPGNGSTGPSNQAPSLTLSADPSDGLIPLESTITAVQSKDWIDWPSGQYSFR